MAAWSLDEKRFKEEVFRALDNRWEPQSNYFRCVQLPVDVTDAGVIAAAFKAVRAYVNRNLKTGTSSGAAKVLDKVLPDAERTLTDPKSRQEHQAQVLAQRKQLATSLRAQLGGLPAVPPAAVKALADERQRFFTREEVQDALVVIGCPVREPVVLPPTPLRAPANWKSVQHEVTFLGFPTLRAYLQEHFRAVTAVTAQQLTQRQTELQRTASGDVLTAETSIVTNVKRWVADGQLVDLLRADLLRDLTAESSMGAERLTAALAAPGTPRYLQELGLPAAADLSYALLCAQRYPAEAAATWQDRYREARADRDLRGARDVLVANRSALDKTFAAELTDLEAELARVDAMRERARALERTDVEAAAEEYVRILEVWRSAEVESALRRCPPAPPTRASARVSGETVTVEWVPTTARAGEITYRVVRHVSGGGSGDGAVLGTGLTGRTVVDEAAPAGAVLTYSVWTLRGDEPSSSAAVTADVAVLRAVRNLELLPGERVVEVQWDLPAGATGARVTRRVDGAAPERPRRVGGGSLRDADVRVGTTYEYVVESEYRLADGRLHHGPPVAGQARPQEPPRPVGDLAWAVEDDGLVLTWTAPARGDVEVRVLDAAPSVRAGQVVAANAVARLGSRARSAGAPRPGRLRTTLPVDGRRHWLLPLTVVDGMAVAGVAVEYDSRLPAVSDLRAEQVGEQIRLRWRWPEKVSEVLVLSRDAVPPTGPDDPRAVHRRLTHAMYQRVGATVAATGSDQWIGVCVTAYTDGAPVHGPMATVSVSVPRELAYEIQKVSGFRNRQRRRLVVALRGAVDVGVVTVVARPRLPPLSREDGVELESFGPAPPGADTLEGELVLREPGRPLFLRAFPAAGASYVLVPTHPMQLRID